MRIACITTQSDWAAMFGNWGRPGVRFILDRCKKAGMTKVYWRVTDGGRMMYHTKIGEIEAALDGSPGARHLYGGSVYEAVDYVCPDIWIRRKMGRGYGASPPSVIKRIARYYAEEIAVPDDVGLWLNPWEEIAELNRALQRK